MGEVPHEKEKILVAGSLGYIGGRLIPKLVEESYSVRILTHAPKNFAGRSWWSQVEMHEWDKSKPECLISALEDIDVVFYLVPKWSEMSVSKQIEIAAARQISLAAKTAGVKRVIYLGGIEYESRKEDNPHQPRTMIGNALRQSGIQVIELRASIIFGSGSMFFEIIRNLVEKSPVMLLPKLFTVHLHPIADHDVLEYLSESICIQEQSNITVDIGTSNNLSLFEMLVQYASVRGINRWIKPIPGIPNWVASFWINFITPVPIKSARPLMAELWEEKPVLNQAALAYFPNIEPVTFEESVRQSLDLVREGIVETSWSDILASGQEDDSLEDLLESGGIVFEHRQVNCPAPAPLIFDVLQGLGGSEGWLFLNWAWKLRGFLDRLTGGVGLQRGRRTHIDLRVGDALDFWRVEEIIPDRKLRLYAEMSVPGQAWLEFELQPIDELETIITQMAFFAPKGLSGLAYWYILFPIHKILFTGLIRKISEKSISLAKAI
jgi:uncharacterized protein YbjT (DUF2867 family)